MDAPVATKSKFLSPSNPPPPGACDISVRFASLIWTYSPNLVTVWQPKLKILHFTCKLNKITDKQTDRWTDDPITRCPLVDLSCQGHNKRNHMSTGCNNFIPWLKWSNDVNLGMNIHQNMKYLQIHQYHLIRSRCTAQFIHSKVTLKCNYHVYNAKIALNICSLHQVIVKRYCTLSHWYWNV